MGKKHIIISILFIVTIFLISLFISNKNTLPYEIINKNWYCEQTGETLKFTNNGKISFYNKRSGNPVDDFDLCKKFIYDDEKEEITFKCEKNAKVSNMKIISKSDEKLVIIYKSEIKIFILDK